MCVRRAVGLGSIRHTALTHWMDLEALAWPALLAAGCRSICAADSALPPSAPIPRLIMLSGH